MAEKSVEWNKLCAMGAIHHLSWVLKALSEKDNPSRIPVAEKHLEFAHFDLSHWVRSS